MQRQGHGRARRGAERAEAASPPKLPSRTRALDGSQRELAQRAARIQELKRQLEAMTRPLWFRTLERVFWSVGSRR